MVVPVVEQLVTLILLMLMGVILYKREYLTTETAKALSIVLTRVAVPCNMFVLLQRPYTTEIMDNLIAVCISTLLMSCVLSFVFFCVAKCLKFDLQNCGLFMSGGSYSNVIFMGQPLVLSMFDEEALIYCIGIMTMCNVYLLTACSVFFSFGSNKKKSISDMLKDLLTNTLFLSTFFAIIIFINGITLPAILNNALVFSANTTVCLSMIYIGVLLASANIKEVFKDKSVYIFSFFCLVVTPILTKFIIGEHGLNLVSGVPLSVLIILFSTPTAAAFPSFAEMYGSNGKRASEYVFVSTMFSLITLPLVAMFLI